MIGPFGETPGCVPLSADEIELRMLTEALGGEITADTDLADMQAAVAKVQGRLDAARAQMQSTEGDIGFIDAQARDAILARIVESEKR